MNQRLNVCFSFISVYTKELITNIIIHFKERHDLSISDEIAEGYLDSLADLFGAFVALLREKQNLENGDNSDTIDA